MLELIRRTLLSGIGLAVMTKDAVEDIANELVRKGELSEKEGREFVDELQQKSEAYQRDLDAKIRSVATSILDLTMVATKSEVAELRKRVESLEAQLRNSSNSGAMN